MIIPDYEFRKLERYVRQEAFLGRLAARIRALPITEGTAFALCDIELMRAENDYMLDSNAEIWRWAS